jgi:hypothetical protein
MGFPQGTKIFGITVADLRNKGILDLVQLEDSERMRILSKDGKFSWRSSVLFGGSKIYYETLKTKDPISAGRGGAIPSKVYIPGRILTRDLDGSGRPVIIAYRNEPGEIYALVWVEDALITDWKTREVSGYIADYQVKDVDNDGLDELVVGVGKAEWGLTGTKHTSNIFFFKLF